MDYVMRRSIGTATVFLLALTIHWVPSLLQAGGEPPAGPTVAFVADISGKWELESRGHQRAVELGQALPAGGLLQPKSEAAMIAIAFFDGTSCRTPLHAVDTGATKECPQPLRLPDSTVKDRTFIERLQLAIKRFIAAEGTYVPVFGRGAEEDSLQEAVLKITQRGIDLRPVLKEKGVYRLRIQRRVRQPGGAIAWRFVKEERVSRHAGTSVLVSAKELEPGLYRFLELNPQSEPTGTEAWVVMVRSKVYNEVSPLFARARGVTNLWSTQIGRERARGYLRAYLDEVSASVEVQGEKP